MEGDINLLLHYSHYSWIFFFKINLCKNAGLQVWKINIHVTTKRIIRTNRKAQGSNDSHCWSQTGQCPYLYTHAVVTFKSPWKCCSFIYSLSWKSVLF